LNIELLPWKSLDRFIASRAAEPERSPDRRAKASRWLGEGVRRRTIRLDGQSHFACCAAIRFRGAPMAL